MLPVLLDLKFIKIYTFGVFLVLAFFWGSFLLWKTILLTAYKEEDVFDGVFLSLAGGFIISRFVHVFLNFDKFGFSIPKFILINGFPGLSLYGFIIGSFLTLYLYFIRKKIKFKEAIDYFIPAVFLALGLGKLGSFFSLPQINFFPLFESVFFFLGTFFSYQLLFAIRRNKLQKGFNFYFFLWYIGVIFFLSLQAQSKDILTLKLAFNPLFSLLLLLTFSFYFIYYFRSTIFGKLRVKRDSSKGAHGKKNQQNTHQGTHEETSGGEGEAPDSDR